MLNRKVQPVLEGRLASFPAVALLGPRQCGKTTLAKSLATDYFDLEQETDQLRLDLTWDEVCAGNGLVVLDEAQEWPALFPRLRGEIDRNRSRNRRFLILGSVSPALMINVSESLAGRLAIVELTPFLLTELSSNAQRQRHWLMGGYPDGGILNGQGFPTWHRSYLDLLRQRDLPGWGLTASPQVTMRLLQMLAISNCQEWNASQLGKSLGLSYHTVNTYVDFLEGAYLVSRLPAFHANIRKRLVKRPKLLWRDSGLLHSLMHVADNNSLMTQPWVGASWEGYCIQQLRTALQLTDRPHSCYYMRSSDQHEIDLVVEIGGARWAIEFKLTTRPGRDDFSRLNKAADLINADKRILISRSTELIQAKQQISGSLEKVIEIIQENSG